ncbi:hypothetical protein BKA64DRAFT_741252 [Cadophora sp. MPI-SDFR-AT-0126]|nr:hypothetical protein BKA64DRAFT_741252 [Leotiomycetes sp. MPI-SDFR-AT-0126]
MSSRKRKAVARSNCLCEDEHYYSQRECDEHVKHQLPITITPRVRPFSETVTMLVGSGKQKFSLHKDLLGLPSTQDDQKMALPDVDPGNFAVFVAWMYKMTLPTPGIGAIMNDSHLLLVRQWVLGSKLLAPRFQNDIFIHYQNFSRHHTTSAWPDIDSVRAIHSLTLAGSKLRKFAADSVATNPPFKEHRPGSSAFVDWNHLFKEYPEMSLDIVNADGTEWNDGFP